MTDTDTNTTDDEENWHDNDILHAMRTNASGDARKFDARRVTSLPGENTTAYSDSPPEIKNKWTLAALYYGGCHGSPDGMGQRDLAEYLGVSRSEVSRRLHKYGIYAPTSVVEERSRRAGRNMPAKRPGGDSR